MNKVEEKYRAEEQVYWKKFYKELNELKEQLEATNVELAEGLGISRQSLVTFMSSPDKEKLPISRANILQLFDRLTDSKIIQESKRLSDEAKDNREKFQEKGLETLLNAVGFTNVTSKQHLDVDSNKYPFIESIINRLSNLKFTDADFSKLITDIETQISNSINTQTKEITYVNQKNEFWLEEWINETFVNSLDSVTEKFIRQIKQYESLGKTEFTSVELYELYMSILGNESFFNNSNKYLKFKIIDCNFNTLTFSIQKYINHESYEFKGILDKIEKKANKYLGQDIKSSPVVDVLITCYSKGDQEDVNWHFSSSGTHITNLLSAVEHGMGYYSSILELTDLSIKSLGIKSHSLAKIVVGLSEVSNRKFYRGSWVSGNAIIGIVQALVNAGTGWLSSMLDAEGCQKYYETCKQIAEIQDEVTFINKLLSEYILKEVSRQDDKIIKKCVIERCSNTINKISELQEKISAEDKRVFNFYTNYLDKIIHTVKLLRIYAALLKGDLEKVEEDQNDAMSYSYKTNQYQPISVLYSIVGMVYKFFSGDKAFVNKKQWRDHEQFNIQKKLYNYIKTGAIGDKSYNGYIDVTEYRSASEYFGNISTMEFYACSSKDILEFEHVQQRLKEPIEYNIIDNFLVAAYYAAKIGQKQRTVHWLLMASRTYCRLKAKDKAETLIKVAEAILDEAIDPKYFFEYKESIKTEVELVRGEIFLLEEKYQKALPLFLKSLKGSIYLELTLLVADNLYNIFRTARKLEQKEFYKLYTEYFPLKKQYSKKEYLEEEYSEEEYLEDNQILKNVINFLNSIKEEKQIDTDKFKYQAQEIWKEWFSKKSRSHIENEKHIIVEMIENGTFLDYLAD
ncbi:hypothetical protein RIVM261_075520 [Rivularia sp. IAM M-261]|nr:hypothetical protein RIVM261_075520 [Rivularia sp. IAM M-261]